MNESLNRKFDMSLPDRQIKSFGLKNFRVFKEYTNFNLKPLTVLIGSNNSGKSSLTKALLLLKENESEINIGLAGSAILNYFKGEHNLGNHQLVKNISDQNTDFYFTFFLDYQLTIEISPDGIILNDYNITRASKPVICDYGGIIKFNYIDLIKYFKARISNFEFDDKNKLLYFISCLEKESKKGFHSFEINLWDEIDRTNDKGEVIKERVEEFTARYEKLMEKGIYTTLFDLDCSELNLNIDYIDEDILDLDWYISLIYVFYKITGVELTEDEITKLIPFKHKALLEGDTKKISMGNIYYIPTIKEQVKRIYSTNDKSIIYNLINKEIQTKIDGFNNAVKHEINVRKNKNEDIKTYRSVNEFAEKWLQEFDIGEKLSYGYDNETDTFFIKIDDKYLPEYGFGYSQVLYLIFALHRLITTERSNSVFEFPITYIIEEPETGLHPAFQSKIAEMIVDAQKKFNINFIIETHSEYFIRKLQLLTANKTIKPDDTIIYYFNNPKHLKPNENLVNEINIDEYGGLSDSFGTGFFDEATSLKFELIHLNRKQRN
jgi:predicted ATPase